MRIRILILLFIGLVGCHQAPRAIDEDVPTLPQAVDGASDPLIVAWQNKLAKDGVRVISMGQMYLVSIPSKLIFAEESPKINWDAYRLLDDVACYLQKFRKISLHVTAYTSCYLSESRSRALSLARGREVANYLWSQNIESRMIVMQGMGDTKPISRDKSCSDASTNSRIEIIFRRAVA